MTRFTLCPGEGSTAISEQHGWICPFCKERCNVRKVQDYALNEQGFTMASHPTYLVDRHPIKAKQVCECGEAIWDETDYLCPKCRNDLA